MCVDCGCSDGAKTTVTNVKTGKVSEIWRSMVTHLHDQGYIEERGQHTHAADGHHHDRDHHHGHSHSNDHSHVHGDDHSHAHGVVDLQQAILTKNDTLAARNRAWLAGREVLMLNLVS